MLMSCSCMHVHVVFLYACSCRVPVCMVMSCSGMHAHVNGYVLDLGQRDGSRVQIGRRVGGHRGAVVIISMYVCM